MSAVLALVFPLTAVAAPPRAASVTASPPERDSAARIALARAALVALDTVKDVTPLQAEALREALIPASSESVDATAEAFALASSALPVAAQNALAGAALYERALGLVFEKLPSASARRFLAAHAAPAEKVLRAAQRLSPALERRLRLWLFPNPQAATGRLALAIEPEQATIYLDGHALTPAKRDGVFVVEHEVGAHDLRVEKDGFTSMARTIELAAPVAGPAASPAVAPAALPRIAVTLAPQVGTEDLVRQRAALDKAGKSLDELAPLLGDLAERLDVALVFLTTPDDGGALVRLYDAKVKAFTGASPVGTPDAPTLARAFRALLDLRKTGTRLVSASDADSASAKKKKKKVTGKRDPLWKKWWFWTLALAGAGAVTGAVVLTQRDSAEGTLSIHLRRAQ